MPVKYSDPMLFVEPILLYLSAGEQRLLITFGP